MFVCVYACVCMYGCLCLMCVCLGGGGEVLAYVLAYVGMCVYVCMCVCVFTGTGLYERTKLSSFMFSTSNGDRSEDSHSEISAKTL